MKCIGVGVLLILLFFGIFVIQPAVFVFAASGTVNISATVLGCGDNIIEGIEQCDGSNLGGATCASLGFSGGVLGCDASCDFDVSQCTGVSAPMVAINSITGNTIPNISVSTTIKNEGAQATEYQYEWCVVPGINDTCEGGNAISYDARAQMIQPGESINPTLISVVPDAGNYYFRLTVYYGSGETSNAVKYFTAVAASPPPPSSGGGGGGVAPIIIPPATTCNGADFNHDGKVNSIDFSILLAFWHTNKPFRNPCVDINHDGQVNSVEFSILMYQWGTKGIPWVPKK